MLHSALGYFPAERCLVLRDRMIKKVVCLEKHLKLWQGDKCDFLVQEAIQVCMIDTYIKYT